MCAALAALVTLVTVVALATANDSGWPLQQYVVILHKGSQGGELDEPLGPFYIPDGQCSGVLDDLLICTSGSAATAVRVVAEDATSYPRVALHDSLLSASVLRSPPCRGEAAVTVQLACDPPDTH